MSDQRERRVVPARGAGTPDAVSRVRRVAATALPLMLAFTTLTAVPAAADPEGPSENEVERSREEVRERVEAVEDTEAELAQARGRLDALSAKAQRVLEKFYREQVELERARKKHGKARERLRQAERGVTEARDEIGQIAAAAYRGQGRLNGLSMMLDADGPQDLMDRMSTMRMLSRERSATLDRMRSAEIVADVLREESGKALEEQQQATRRVEKAKKSAQAAVRKQRAEMRLIERLEAERRDSLDQARDRADRLERQRAEYLEALEEARESEEAREARAATREATKEAAEVTGVSDCADKPVSLDGYSNGLIPPQALCPLPQDGHMLRADAAAAFESLNQAYASAFGEPICVTDSYRDLTTQQYLYRTKPSLAAVPGTSNHGWGVAVDLCGGINSYGTSTHQWMRANAPEYGWILPAWARADGSMPEPWHWEYTGSASRS